MIYFEMWVENLNIFTILCYWSIDCHSLLIIFSCFNKCFGKWKMNLCWRHHNNKNCLLLFRTWVSINMFTSINRLSCCWRNIKYKSQNNLRQISRSKGEWFELLCNLSKGFFFLFYCPTCDIVVLFICCC